MRIDSVYRYIFVVGLLAWGSLLMAASSSDADGDGYPMRWRIFRDPVSATTFRFPYDYRIPDQYKGDLEEGRGGGNVISIDPKIANDPKKLQAFLEKMAKEGQLKDTPEREEGPKVRHRWIARDKLPTTVDENDLGAVLAVLAEKSYATVEPFDYYSDLEHRPFGDPKWAAAGITAIRASDKGRCAELIAYPEGFAAVLLSGDIDKENNRAILDSFEILGVVKKGDRPTWRETQTTKYKKVFDASGKPVPFGKAAPVDWAQAWECETPNYHITCSDSPLTTASVGALMEALHVAYSDVFKPDAMPPYKLEIHILPDVRGFARMANTKGFGPVQDGSGGSLTGGFFVPSQLCTYSFAAPVNGYPTRMESVLAHEATHQFLHVTCNGSDHVPTWINEGLAVYFESGEFKNGRFTWKPPTQRLSQLQMQYQQLGTTLTPLEDYFNHHGHIPASNYAEVYAMTHFWIFGSESGSERFKLYWQALKTGEDGNDAFERIFMEDMIKAQGGRTQALAKFAEVLREYVKRNGPLTAKKR